MSDFPTADMELTHILVVYDVGASVGWYRDVLGAKLTREYGGTSAVFNFNGVWLLLVTGGEPTDDKPDVTFAVPSDRSTVSHSFTIRVQDCQAAYELPAVRGAEFLTPPYDWGGEIRSFFRDPDGHLSRSARFLSRPAVSETWTTWFFSAGFTSMSSSPANRSPSTRIRTRDGSDSTNPDSNP